MPPLVTQMVRPKRRTPDLPLEVISLIIDRAIPPSFAIPSIRNFNPDPVTRQLMRQKLALVLVSKAWYQAGISQLYHTIAIPTVAQLNKLHDTLKDQPALRRHVKCLSVGDAWARACTLTGLVLGMCSSLQEFYYLPVSHYEVPREERNAHRRWDVPNNLLPQTVTKFCVGTIDPDYPSRDMAPLYHIGCAPFAPQLTSLTIHTFNFLSVLPTSASSESTFPNLKEFDLTLDEEDVMRLVLFEQQSQYPLWFMPSLERLRLTLIGRFPIRGIPGSGSLVWDHDLRPGLFLSTIAKSASFLEVSMLSPASFVGVSTLSTITACTSSDVTAVLQRYVAAMPRLEHLVFHVDDVTEIGTFGADGKGEIKLEHPTLRWIDLCLSAEKEARLYDSEAHHVDEIRSGGTVIDTARERLPSFEGFRFIVSDFEGGAAYILPNLPAELWAPGQPTADETGQEESVLEFGYFTFKKEKGRLAFSGTKARQDGINGVTNVASASREGPTIFEYAYEDLEEDEEGWYTLSTLEESMGYDNEDFHADLEQFQATYNSQVAPETGD